MDPLMVGNRLPTNIATFRRIKLYPISTYWINALVIYNLIVEILREDRIWIRNQLKAGDPEIIIIFKEMKKPLSIIYR